MRRSYVLKRLLLFFPTLLGVVLINFAIIQLVPGGPVAQMMAAAKGQMGSGEAPSGASSERRGGGRAVLDAEQIAALNHLYGFDLPWYERLGRWTVHLFTFRFGTSYVHEQPVTDLALEKMPVTLWLGVSSFLLTYLVSIPLGIAKAVRHGSAFDLASSLIVVIGYGIPGFVLGVLLLWLLGGGSGLDLVPLSGLHSEHAATLSRLGRLEDTLWHLALPLLCLNIGSFAVMTLLAKNAVLDQLQQQYVLTARAKGVSPFWVVQKHVLRNCLIPLLTGFVSSFVMMFVSGSLLIESLFSLDGLGLLAYESVLRRDYPVVMASQFFLSLLFIVSNLVTDLLYTVVDPRLNFAQATE